MQFIYPKDELKWWPRCEDGYNRRDECHTQQCESDYTSPAWYACSNISMQGFAEKNHLAGWPNNLNGVPCHIQPFPEEGKHDAADDPNNGRESYEDSEDGLMDALLQGVPIGN